MRFVATIGNQEHTIEVDANGHARRVRLDGRELVVDWRLAGAEHTHLDSTALEGAPADHYSVLVGPYSYDAYVQVREGEGGTTQGPPTYTLEVYIRGRPYVVMV